MISVAIIEDHQILVDSLGLMLRYEPDMEFLGAASSVSDGQQLVQHSKPDVLLLDVGLPDGNGLDIIPEINSTSPDPFLTVSEPKIDYFRRKISLIDMINETNLEKIKQKIN